MQQGLSLRSSRSDLTLIYLDVTPVEGVESIPVVVGEDLIMSGEINEITCITGHLLVMVW